VGVVKGVVHDVPRQTGGKPDLLTMQDQYQNFCSNDSNCDPIGG
jgi:hypothetical protein